MKRGEPKVSTTCYIRPEQLEKLRELSRKTGVSMAEYVRQGIEKVLERHGAKADKA